MYKVAKIIDKYKVVINAGSRQDVCEGQKYLIYAIDNNEIFDPDPPKMMTKNKGVYLSKTLLLAITSNKLINR